MKRPPRIDERQRRVQILADAMDDHDPDVVQAHADALERALSRGLDAQKFFSQLRPVLRGHKINTPPSLHTWRAVHKELKRRAAKRLSEDRECFPEEGPSRHPSGRTGTGQD